LAISSIVLVACIALGSVLGRQAGIKLFQGDGQSNKAVQGVLERRVLASLLPIRTLGGVAFVIGMPIVLLALTVATGLYSFFWFRQNLNFPPAATGYTAWIGDQHKLFTAGGGLVILLTALAVLALGPALRIGKGRG
jgi:hypothetical protein